MKRFHSSRLASTNGREFWSVYIKRDDVKERLYKKKKRKENAIG